ncbi:sodium:alanine symporter family protein [Ruminococcaceae bacterium OttesenSCG-928-L11]|nr:sodium:alanine symporter family protein [Ruminococcaceae bacterium OttesenSCG-928-L11]
MITADGLSMLALLGLGIVLTAQSRCLQIRKLPFILKHTVGTLLSRDSADSKGISPFQAVTTALAGTMGVGNIAGVATAIVAGGPGAIFWMWVSAFFGMATKYAEIYLAVLYRKRGRDGSYQGGPMHYITQGLGKQWLAVLFAVFCVTCSFGVGNMTQANAVSTAMETAFSIPLWLTGLGAALCVVLVVFGGVKRIARCTELVIPFVSVLYLCVAGVCLYQNRSLLPGALTLIMKSAFGMREAAGGVLGYSVSGAVQLGLSRGVFTNEAGLGSAPIAHAAADTKSPAHQGAWGVFEVFLDTIVVCTVTALVILTAGGGTLWQSGADGAPLTSLAFAATLGDWGTRFIAVSIALFAIPSMLGWCFYGESALSWLTDGNKRAIAVYRILFVVGIGVGAVSGSRLVWAAADTLNALMAAPNIIAVFLLRRQVLAPNAVFSTKQPRDFHRSQYAK